MNEIGPPQQPLTGREIVAVMAAGAAGASRFGMSASVKVLKEALELG